MAIHLDDETEEILDTLIEKTGRTAEDLVSVALQAFDRDVIRQPTATGPTPWEVYSKMDLGDGDASLAPSTESGPRYRELLRRKHER